MHCEDCLRISPRVSIPIEEIELVAIRAQGPGGQNVNKVSNAVRLRFDIPASSLPEEYKQRLLAMADQRLTREGVVVIKAQEHRSLEQNREAALVRLAALIRQATATRKARRPTRPTRASQQRRVAGKKLRGRTKDLRKPPESE